MLQQTPATSQQQCKILLSKQHKGATWVQEARRGHIFGIQAATASFALRELPYCSPRSTLYCLCWALAPRCCSLHYQFLTPYVYVMLLIMHCNGLAGTCNLHLRRARIVAIHLHLSSSPALLHRLEPRLSFAFDFVKLQIMAIAVGRHFFYCWQWHLADIWTRAIETAK